MSGNKGELPIAAFENAFLTYSIMIRVSVQYILNQALYNLGQEWELKDLGNKYSEKTLHSNLRLLRKIEVVRAERIGNSTIYKLNHDRLDTIKAASARLL